MEAVKRFRKGATLLSFIGSFLQTLTCLKTQKKTFVPHSLRKSLETSRQRRSFWIRWMMTPQITNRQSRQMTFGFEKRRHVLLCCRKRSFVRFFEWRCATTKRSATKQEKESVSDDGFRSLIFHPQETCFVCACFEARSHALKRFWRKEVVSDSCPMFQAQSETKSQRQEIWLRWTEETVKAKHKRKHERHVGFQLKEAQHTAREETDGKCAVTWRKQIFWTVQRNEEMKAKSLWKLHIVTQVNLSISPQKQRPGKKRRQVNKNKRKKWCWQHLIYFGWASVHHWQQACGIYERTWILKPKTKLSRNRSRRNTKRRDQCWITCSSLLRCKLSDEEPLNASVLEVCKLCVLGTSLLFWWGSRTLVSVRYLQQKFVSSCHLCSHFRFVIASWLFCFRLTSIQLPWIL